MNPAPGPLQAPEHQITMVDVPPMSMFDIQVSWTWCMYVCVCVHCTVYFILFICQWWGAWQDSEVSNSAPYK